jgi:hypothetical protein
MFDCARALIDAANVIDKMIALNIHQLQEHCRFLECILEAVRVIELATLDPIPNPALSACMGSR